MGKTLGVSLLVVALLASCSKTTDNHNIFVTFYKDGQKNIAQISPNDQLIEEEQVYSHVIYKDKLDRWQFSSEKVLSRYDDGSLIVQDTITGNTFLKYKNDAGVYVTEDFWKHQSQIQMDSSKMEKIKIDNCDFGIVEYDYSNDKPSYSYPDNFEFDFKIEDIKIPPIPEKIRNQYKVDDPFFITFDTIEEGWQKYQTLTKGKTITYGREIEKEFLSSKYYCGFAYKRHESDPQLYRYDNVNPEPNSYWVDRKVGTFKYQRYEPKPCREVPILRSSHFKEDVKKYVEKSLKPTWFRTCDYKKGIATERSVIESARITMIPMNKKIWMILVSSQAGKLDPNLDGIWTFSVVEFDSDKPVHRAWGRASFSEIDTNSMQGFVKTNHEWSDPELCMNLYGIGDVNFDGFNDFVFQYIGWGCATHDSKKIFIVTLTDEGFGEIEPKITHALYDFYGFDGNKPLFSLKYYGTGQMYKSYKDESLASTRWNRHILKVVEPRKDGNLYMVSYKYNTDLEELEQDIKSKHIYYLSLGNYEIIGKARAAQKAFLETSTYTSPEQLEIVKILLKKNHTMFVDCEEGLLPELKKFNPYP